MSQNHQENGKSSEDWASPSHMHFAFFMLSLLLGIYLCYLIALPFLPSLAWAIGLSVLAAPLQKWLETKLRHPSLCSLACTLILSLVVVVPTSFAIQQLIVQAANGAKLMEAKIQSGEWRQVFSSQPQIASALEWLESQVDLPGIAKMFASSMSEATLSILRGSFYQLIDFGLTFYLLFFLLRDRDLALKTLCRFSPLTEGQMSRVYQRVHDTICATVYGSFVVSVVQGAALGITFWGLELPAPVLWGMIMAGLALAPVAGAFLVWGPAAVFLVVDGHWVKAILLVAAGVFVIVIVDNMLRPILVGKRLQTHTVLVFISVVGGMLLFGPSGILLGPIVLMITQVLLELHHEKSMSMPAKA
jgi:predicted PurR-regulated permease PerM